MGDFLAARPYRGDYYNIGRETFLLPVKWTDGWPTITRPGNAIPYLAARPDLPMQAATAMPTRGAFVIRDEFDAPALAQQWLRIRTPDAPWHDLATEPGTLILQARPEPLGGRGQPSYFGRRLQHHWEGAGSCALRADVARRSGWHRNRAERESLLCADTGG